jgi:hypothetical protein
MKALLTQRKQGAGPRSRSTESSVGSGVIRASPSADVATENLLRWSQLHVVDSWASASDQRTFAKLHADVERVEIVQTEGLVAVQRLKDALKPA